MPQPRKKQISTKVAIVDDHELFRDAVSRHLGAISDFGTDLLFEIVIEADNGKEFCDKATTYNKEVDLVILDLNMPVMDGIQTLKWIKQNHSSKVLILTMYDDPFKVTECMKEGADGYLTKNASFNKLTDALKSIMAKGYYYDDFITKSLIEALKQINYSTRDSYGQAMLATKALTEREKEVLKWLATELGYREIAEKMGISLRTIEGYRDNLFTKLEANSRVGAVVNAIRFGVLNFHEL